MLKYINKQITANITEIIFSILFATIFVFGYVLSANDFIEGTKNTGIYVTGWCVIFIVFLTIMLNVKNVLKKRIKAGNKRPDTFFDKQTARRQFIIVASLFFLSYIPVIVMAGSNLTYDSWSSIHQIQGDAPITAAHPVIYTGFLGIFVSIGQLFNNLNLGLQLYSICQAMILAMIFASSILYIRRLGVSNFWLVIISFFYMIVPINSFAGITVWKDVLFAAFGLMMVIYIIRMFSEKNFFTTKNMILFVVFGSLFCIWRNNGIYAYVIMLIIMLIVYRHLIFKKVNIRYATILAIPLLIGQMYNMTTSVLYGTPSSSEAMSVPLQQIARTVKYHKESISYSDKVLVNKILPVDDLPRLYNPGLSDPVKGSFNKENYNKNKLEYIKLWAKLAIDYKKTYLAAFMYNTYGYTYPMYKSPAPTSVVHDNSTQINAPPNYVDSNFANGRKATLNEYRNMVDSVMPVLSNVGFYTCIILFSVYLSLKLKRREIIPAMALLFAMYLTTILGPVNGEFRYLYIFAVAMPVVLSVSLMGAKKQTNNFI